MIRGIEVYTHILLDADNTLLDFDKAQLISFVEVLEYYNLEFSETLYEQYVQINHNLWNQFEAGILSKDIIISKRFSEFFAASRLSVDGAQANLIYQRSLQKQSWLMPFAKEVCNKLSNHAILSIVTNGVGDTQTQRITHSDIWEYISFLIISEIIGVTKPHVEFFHETFKIIGCTNTDKILIVGDSLSSDIQGGINSGIDTCWYNPKKLKNENNLKIDYIISDLRDLINIISNS